MTKELAVSEGRHGGALTALDIRAQVNLVQEVMKAVMKEGTHYGKIPGTPKPSLWKPGAEVLAATFRVAVSYRIDDLSTDDYVRYRVVALGTHQTSGIVLGEGVGEASSNEQKYKWVKAGKREWEASAENRRRKKFGYDKDKREEYEILQVRTEPADVANTILKMAAKRAQVAMTLNVTAASDIFTQDIEDLPEELQRDIEPGDAATATGDGKGYRQPRSKKDKQASPAGATAGSPATASSGNPEPAKVEPAEVNMIEHFKKRIAGARSTWEAELAHANFPPGHTLTKVDCEAMLRHAQQPSGIPSQAGPGELALQG